MRFGTYLAEGNLKTFDDVDIRICQGDFGILKIYDGRLEDFEDLVYYLQHDVEFLGTTFNKDKLIMNILLFNN